MIDEVREKIENIIQPYNGSFKHLKQSFLIKRYGANIITDIENVTTFLDNSSSLQERCYCILKNIIDRPVCETCKGRVKFRTREQNNTRYATLCSNKCKGGKAIQDKKRKTNLERYGSSNVLNSSKVKEIREKRLVETVGSTNYFTSEKYKLRRLNGDFKEAVDRSKYTIKESHLDRGYQILIDKIGESNCKPAFSREEYQGHHEKYNFECKKCNQVFYKWLGSIYDIICPACNPKVGTDIERFVEEILQKYKIEYSSRTKTVLSKGRQLDFYIPSKKLGIEVHGLYWHRECDTISKNYHLDKLNECERLDVRLIQIFDDEIKEKPEIVESRLKSILGISTNGIFARKCTIEVVSSVVALEFYNKNHIQGGVNSKVNLALMNDNVIYAIASFSSLRISTGNSATAGEYELTRYSTLLNHNIPGGFSKLLKFFVQTYKPKRIISYCDRRWSRGDMYKINGFIEIKKTTPNYWYIAKSFLRRMHRYQYQKHLLKEKLESFDNSISEWENMKNNGYSRIWDCGSYLFEYNNSSVKLISS